jgi:predicted Rossmann fold nucleotide-binding protein DprA/Smf involved in DNA uptake
MTKQKITYIGKEELTWASGASATTKGYGKIASVGNADLIRQEKLALFCSARCPGRLILQTYDLAQRFRQSGLVIMGGFHTPMEKECLSILLRGPAPVMVCPARGIETMRLPAEWQAPIEQDRLLVLSPFDEKHSRITKETSESRNEFVAAVANQVFVAHAAPGGRTEALCREVIAWGKPLLTLDGAENANLFEMGATPFA